MQNGPKAKDKRTYTQEELLSYRESSRSLPPPPGVTWLMKHISTNQHLGDGSSSGEQEFQSESEEVFNENTNPVNRSMRSKTV